MIYTDRDAGRMGPVDCGNKVTVRQSGKVSRQGEKTQYAITQWLYRLDGRVTIIASSRAARREE